jgi:topoisomerase-4 subunit A
MLEAVTTTKNPVLILNTGRGQQLTTKKIKVADLVDVMGWKAIGSKLADFAKSVEMEWEQKIDNQSNQTELF